MAEAAGLFVPPQHEVIVEAVFPALVVEGSSHSLPSETLPVIEDADGKECEGEDPQAD